jgi:hypothetical protein
MDSKAHVGKLRVIYIMGTGRSGSTILDMALGSTPGSVSTGELVSLEMVMNETNEPDERSAKEFCSCESPVRSCTLWSTVWQEFSKKCSVEEYRRSHFLYERGWSPPFAFIGRFLRLKSFTRHVEMTNHLLSSISTATGSKTIIDSSKLTSRAVVYVELQRYGVEVLFINIVRDLDGYIESWRRKRDPGNLQAISPKYTFTRQVWDTLNWICATALSTVVGRVLRAPYTLVRFKELMSRPTGVISRLSGFASLDASDVCQKIAKGNALSPGHVIAGNRAKFSPIIKIMETS